MDADFKTFAVDLMLRSIGSSSGTARSFWAPGRVNLIGEHTDFTGGLVLPVAVDLGVTVTGVAAERIVLETDGPLGGLATVDASGSDARNLVGWGRYVAAVARELTMLGRPAVGLAGTVRSTLPSGAGLSSSAALEVAIATALCAVADFTVAPLELAAACQRAEVAAVGVPCGIMDQAASILGVARAAVYLDCGTLAHEIIRLPDDVALIVVDSGLRHTHEFSGYAERRSQLEKALVALEGRRPADVSVAEAERAADAWDLDELHWRRLRHVVSENSRVRKLARVLKSGSGSTSDIGQILLDGQASQRDDYEASLPELDCLVELAYDHGAIGARMTGGGFGGSVLVLAATGDAIDIGSKVVRSYRDRFEREAIVRICSAGAGAHEVDWHG